MEQSEIFKQLHKMSGLIEAIDDTLKTSDANFLKYSVSDLLGDNFKYINLEQDQDIINLKKDYLNSLKILALNRKKELLEKIQNET